MATPALQDHMRRKGPGTLSQRMQLKDNLVVDSIGNTAQGNPKSIYYPLGLEHAHSPVEFNARAADYLAHKTNYQAALSNSAKRPSVNIGAQNLHPILIAPHILAENGMRYNTSYMPMNPTTSTAAPLAYVARQQPQQPPPRRLRMRPPYAQP